LAAECTRAPKLLREVVGALGSPALAWLVDLAKLLLGGGLDHLEQLGVQPEGELLLALRCDLNRSRRQA
jgi:hypothetical protein